MEDANLSDADLGRLSNGRPTLTGGEEKVWEYSR